MKIFTSFFLIFCGANLLSYSSYSQINSFPYYQDFESSFITGENIEFIPGWHGNTVETSTRIHQAKTLGLEGSSALVITPTSSFTAVLTIALNLKNIQNSQLQFVAASAANGTGTYPSKMEISTSVDGGSTFSSPVEIGAAKFTNANTEFSSYTYSIPPSAKGMEKVVVKITVKRGSSGSGTAAKVLIDDFKIFEETITRVPVKFRDIQINEIYADPSGPFAPESGNLPNAEFIELYNASDSSINLAGFSLNNIELSPIDFPAKTYLIACHQNAAKEFEPFGNVLALPSWPALTNTSKYLSLTDAEGRVIDSLTYQLHWYKDKQKQEGGWTIEQINPNSTCLGPYNYASSQSTTGGTPGHQNSVYSTTPLRDLKVESILIDSDNSFKVHFSKPYLNNSISTHNIQFNTELEVKGLIPLPAFNGFEVVLEEPVAEGKIYSFSITGIQDCDNLTYSIENLNLGRGIKPSFNDLIITEIMADPSPVIGLPETEYIEIFNRSQKLISLNDLSLSNGSTTSPLGEGAILPGEFLVLTSKTGVALFAENQVKSIGLAKWPTLNNTKGELSLIDANHLIFSTSYSSKWHDKEKEDGGYSLEMIDLNNPCREEGNWASTLNSLGGTPGTSNSIIDNRIDLKGPEISNVEVVNDTLIVVELNEKSIAGIIGNSDIVIEPQLDLKTALLDNTKRRITLLFNPSINGKVLYSLTLKNIADCSGNMNSPSYTFARPEETEPMDVVINEVLFNPRKNGVDFIEFYNRSEKYIAVNQLTIANQKEGEIDKKVKIEGPKSMLAPKEYLAVTTDISILKNEYPSLKGENVFELASLPSLPDDEGKILLINGQEKIVDSFYYNENYHLTLLKDVEGVSLERINADMETNDRNNWHSASAEVGFATPGADNSQRFQPESEIEQFSLSPAVFSPDGDGYDDFTMINYSFTSNGNIGTIKIYDKNGRKVKLLADNQSFSNEGFVQWDGTDDSGKRVAIGIYLVFFEFYNLGGKITRFKKDVIVAAKL